uniref:Uncharacterized protein n=1 Tax=Rhizophora mucronata TaxID=61149 RepID=A0A2P2P0S9_RHIMU
MKCGCISYIYVIFPLTYF